MEENFFDLGGHSLLAMQVVSRIMRVLHIEVPIRLLFLNPILREFVREVDRLLIGKHYVEEIERHLSADPLPLSMNQDERLLMDWLNHLRGIKSPPFQHGIALRLTGKLSVQALRSALDETTRRHDVLRSAFPDPAELSSELETLVAEKLSDPLMLQTGIFKQVIHPPSVVPLLRFDLTEIAENRREIEASKIAAEQIESPFPYHQAPLVRALLLKIKEDVSIFVIVIHHMLSDRWSLDVLHRDIRLLYRYYAEQQNHYPLVDLSVQYGEFALWQRKRFQGQQLEQVIKQRKKQWTDFASAQLNFHDLRLSRPPKPQNPFAAGRASIVLDSLLARKVRTFARSNNVTLYMLSLATLYLLFHAHTGKRRIALWGYWANRNRPEAENLIGWISTTQLIGVNIKPETAVEEFIQEVASVVLDTSLFHELPHASGVFLAEKGLPQQLTLSDLYISFDVVTANQPAAPQWGESVSSEPVILPSKQVGSSLEFVLFDDGETLTLSTRYSKDTFAHASIQSMVGKFAELIEQIIAAPDNSIESLSTRPSTALEPFPTMRPASHHS